MYLTTAALPPSRALRLDIGIIRVIVFYLFGGWSTCRLDHVCSGGSRVPTSGFANYSRYCQIHSLFEIFSTAHPSMFWRCPSFFITLAIQCTQIWRLLSHRVESCILLRGIGCRDFVLGVGFSPSCKRKNVSSIFNQLRVKEESVIFRFTCYYEQICFSPWHR